jgi:hypothetical protein
MRSKASKVGSLIAAATAAIAVPMTFAPPSSAAPGDVASPSSIVTYNVWNDCAVWSANCDGYKDGEPTYSLWILYHSKAYKDSSLAMMYGNISNYDYSEVADHGTTYHYHYVFTKGAPTTDGAKGAGQGIKNNAAAVMQCGYDNYRVYYNSGWTGPSQNFPWNNYCNAKVDLNSTLLNENASQHFS